MARQVSLDTSFLISFADPTRANHAVAVHYFRHCQAESIPMWLSVIAAGEFEVKQPVTDLPLSSFRIHTYQLPHALRAARLFRHIHERTEATAHGTRRVIVNDLKLIAQAAEEAIPTILTEDKNTLHKLCLMLNEAGLCAVRPLLLADGFQPWTLASPDGATYPSAPS
ncbi:MAG: hypothetical protein RLY93_09515 [Sumerlaeia bacterium]